MLVLAIARKKSSYRSQVSRSLFVFFQPGHKVNPFPNKPWFLCVCSTSLLKTLGEKEKLLVTSNFSLLFPVFSFHSKNFLPFSSNLKVLSANSFSLEESKICHLEKGSQNVFIFIFTTI